MASRGRKPLPKAVDHGGALAALPRCPAHLDAVARREWRRLASVLHSLGVLTVVDRTALAVYCQCYSRWVEAEEKLAATPMLLKTPSGYVQQSPWLSVANKQIELMGRYMGELGLTPVARARLEVDQGTSADQITRIEFVTVYTDENGRRQERPLDRSVPRQDKTSAQPNIITLEDSDLL